MFEHNLKSLATAVGWDVEELYDIVMKEALSKVPHEKFPVVRVLKDLKTIEEVNKENALIVRDILIDPFQSYNDIALKHGLSSRQIVHWRLKRLSKHIPWIADLIHLRGVSYHTSRASKSR